MALPSSLMSSTGFGGEERYERSKVVQHFQTNSLGGLPASESQSRAAGIDEQSIAQFEQKLQRNLYEVWNRMSSGSYFPPPVQQVEIPTQSGGKTEGAEFWLQVVIELKNRGVQDIFIACVDGLKGFPDTSRKFTQIPGIGPITFPTRFLAARSTGASLALWHGVGSSLIMVPWLCATRVLWLLVGRSAHPLGH